MFPDCTSSPHDPYLLPALTERSGEVFYGYKFMSRRHFWLIKLSTLPYFTKLSSFSFLLWHDSIHTSSFMPVSSSIMTQASMGRAISRLLLFRCSSRAVPNAGFSIQESGREKHHQRTSKVLSSLLITLKLRGFSVSWTWISQSFRTKMNLCVTNRSFAVTPFCGLYRAHAHLWKAD